MASRRPKRKCRLRTSENYSPLTKALGSGRDQEGFQVRYIDGYIGHGVFATQKFGTGDFLLEYKGDLVSRKEGERRESQYTPTKGSFLMFFSYDGKRLCMDGTEDPFDTNMARMINDEGENPNCVMRAMSFLGRPRLCLFALRDISIGEELRYDYGVEDLPWRLESKRKSLRRNTSLDELTFCGLNKQTYPLQVEKDGNNKKLVDVGSEEADVPHTGARRESEGASVVTEQTGCDIPCHGGQTSCVPANREEIFEVESADTLTHACANAVTADAQVDKPLDQTFVKGTALGSEEARNETSKDGKTEIGKLAYVTGNSKMPQQSSVPETAKEAVVVESMKAWVDGVEMPVDIADTKLILARTSNISDSKQVMAVESQGADIASEVTEQTGCNIQSLADQSSRVSGLLLLRSDQGGANTCTYGEVLGMPEVTADAEIHQLLQKTSGVSENTREAQCIGDEEAMSVASVEAWVDGLSDRVEVLADTALKQTFDVPENNTVAVKSQDFDEKLVDEIIPSDISDDDSDYIPASSDEHSSDSSEVFPQLSPVVLKRKSVHGNPDKQENGSMKPEIAKVVENSKLRVPSVQKNTGKRVYDKTQACYYCGKLVKKLARHLDTCHKHELLVAKSSALKGKARKYLIKQLRFLGNFEHNISVIAKGEGELIVVRRGKECLPATAYLPCKFCLGFFTKKELWRHVSSCDMKGVDCEETDADAVKSGKWLLLGSVCPRYEQEDLIQFVLSTLRDDPIADVVKKDNFILQLGNSKLQKLGVKKAAVVREQLRLAARCLIELRKLAGKPTAYMSDFLNPESFDLLVLAVKNVCVQAEQRSMTGSMKFEKPAIALKMGQVLKKMICLKEGWTIRNKDSHGKEEASDLLKLYHREWCDKINSIAFRTLRERKYNNTELLPLTEDLLKLKNYQIAQMKSLVRVLKSKPSGDVWRKLALTTLGRISVFNKRREAEVGEVQLSLYLKSRSSTNVNSDLLQSLTEFERKLCNQMRHLEVMGKQNRKVPIVLTEDMVEAVDTLISHRKWARTSEDNPFLFASGGKSHLKTSQAMKVAAHDAGLSHPELITSTKLRKYMATVSQVISLSENELEYLANHMGHDITVHRNFYRLQDSTLELAKVTRLLLAAEQGKMGSFAGKTLNDITFSDFPDYCEDDCGDSSGEVKAAESEKLSSQVAPNTPRSVTDETICAPSTFVAEETIDNGDITDIVMAGNTKMYKGKAVLRTEWSSDEMKAISDLIDQSVQSSKPPRKADIVSCLSSFPQLSTRKWIQVKFRVWAEAQKIMKKKMSVKTTFLTAD